MAASLQYSSLPLIAAFTVLVHDGRQSRQANVSYAIAGPQSSTLFITQCNHNEQQGTIGVKLQEGKLRK